MKPKHETSREAMPQRAYPYSRFSGSHQKDGDSLRRQNDWHDDVSQENGWILDDTLRFEDKSRSGFHGANLTATADLTRFLGLVEQGRITPGSVLLIENIDRLSRQDVDVAYDLFRGIIRAGVWICTRIPPRVYKQSQNSFMDLMEPIWLMYLNHQESLKKSVRCAAAWETARKEAIEQKAPLPGSHPSWLRKKADGYEVIPEAAATIRRIHALSQSGYGYPAIRKVLEEEGVMSFGRSMQWSDPFLATVLKKRMVLGEYHPHRTTEGRKRVVAGEPIPGYYPAVISEECWLATQAAIARRYNKRGRPGKDVCNLIVGITREAKSRHPLRICSTWQNGVKYPYLQVQPNGGPSISYRDAEYWILHALSMLKPADVIECDGKQREREEEIAKLTARLVALVHRQEQLQKAAADPEQDAGPVLEILRRVSADRTATAKELELKKLEGLSGRAEALAEVQSLHQLRDGLSGDDREEMDLRIRNVIPTVVDCIWMQCQKLSERRQFVHIQVFLHSGEKRYLLLQPKKLKGEAPWDLTHYDLRTGPYEG